MDDKAEDGSTIYQRYSRGYGTAAKVRSLEELRFCSSEACCSKELDHGSLSLCFCWGGLASAPGPAGGLGTTMPLSSQP